MVVLKTQDSETASTTTHYKVDYYAKHGTDVLPLIRVVTETQASFIEGVAARGCLEHTQKDNGFHGLP